MYASRVAETHAALGSREGTVRVLTLAERMGKGDYVGTLCTL